MGLSYSYQNGTHWFCGGRRKTTPPWNLERKPRRLQEVQGRKGHQRSLSFRTALSLPQVGKGSCSGLLKCCNFQLLNLSSHAKDSDNSITTSTLPGRILQRAGDGQDLYVSCKNPRCLPTTITKAEAQFMSHPGAHDKQNGLNWLPLDILSKNKAQTPSLKLSWEKERPCW